MTSEDVVHSFYVPNFRVKKDVIPNRFTRVTFLPDKVGNYQIFCAEFCGDGHSQMLGSIRVVTKEDYEKWQKEQNSGADLPLDQLGEKVYNSKGCSTCHSIDGSPKTGPSWKGIWGQTHKLEGGASVKVDENYIKESVLDPKAKIVAGFQPVMPTFSGLLSEREINGIIEYIKKLK
jgi:cytochrome c oxidase subunit 2